MKFRHAKHETVWILLTEGCISERRLRYEFKLDPDQIDTLRHELIDIKGWVVAEPKGILRWVGTKGRLPAEAPPLPEASPAEPLAAAPPESDTSNELPASERRQLTVMFCDLVGSTPLSTQLDPEDMQNLIAAYHRAVTPAIEKYNGYIAQYMGDGILVYFGYPQARETDAERAIIAGRAVVDTLPQLNAELAINLPEDLAVRIGIATGAVVVGEIIGEGDSQQRAVVGETPNLAARLQGLAPANGLVVSNLTKELADDSFEFQDLGEPELKGIDERIRVWLVGGEKNRTFESETGAADKLSPLVGRQEELGLLLRAWQQSCDGLGQVVAISGEAGIGKSRLVEAITTEVKNAGRARINLRCSPYYTNSVLYPVVEMLHHMLEWTDKDDAPTKLTKMETLVSGYRFSTDETIPLIASLLALPLPQDSYPALTMTPQQQRLRTLDMVIAWLLEEAERHPLLIVWEDLHWVDASTMELLEMMIEQCPTVSVLNVLAFRPEFVPTWPQRTHTITLNLNRLEKVEVEALIRVQTSGKTLPPEVVNHIANRCDGVPLYVEELTRAILMSDSLQETDDCFELKAPLEELLIPATLQDSLMARLDRVPAVRSVAQLGAVFGREFAFEMLKASGMIEEPALRDGLGQLVEAGLLYQRGRPPESKYMFKHALIQDAAYQSLLRRTRQSYHEQIASLLSSHFHEQMETHPEILAHHYLESGNSSQAIHFLLKAGQLAVQHSANHEAVGHLDKALALLLEHGQDPHRELVIQRLRGTSLMAIKGYGAPETVEAFHRARQLCFEVEDDSIHQVLFGVWISELTRANHSAAYEIANDMQKLEGQSADIYAPHAGHVASAVSLLHQGHLIEAREHFHPSLKIHRRFNIASRQSYTRLYGMDNAAATHSYGAWCEWFLGYPDRALEQRQKALEAAKASNHSYSLCRALYLCAVVNQLCGDWQTVFEETEILIQTAREHGLSMVVSLGQIMHGAASAALGDSDGQEAKITEALQGYSTTGARFQSPYHHALLAEVQSRKGDLHSALESINDAQKIIQLTGEHYYSAEIHRLTGEFTRANSNQHSEAETRFMQALELARSQNSKGLELRSACSLARLWLETKKKTAAYDLLSSVYSGFTEGFETRDLQDANNLLEELS